MSHSSSVKNELQKSIIQPLQWFDSSRISLLFKRLLPLLLSSTESFHIWRPDIVTMSRIVELWIFSLTECMMAAHIMRRRILPIWIQIHTSIRLMSPINSLDMISGTWRELFQLIIHFDRAVTGRMVIVWGHGLLKYQIMGNDGMWLIRGRIVEIRTINMQFNVLLCTLLRKRSSIFQASPDWYDMGQSSLPHICGFEVFGQLGIRDRQQIWSEQVRNHFSHYCSIEQWSANRAKGRESILNRITWFDWPIRQCRRQW
jgi:hypothetical protein